MSVLVVSLPLLLAAAGCSSSSGSTTPNSDGGAETADSGPTNTDPNACQLGEVAGATEIVPTFATYDPPASVPTTMTGGTLSGKFVITKAKVFLPTLTKGLADPAKSTGKVTGWANFQNDEYRVSLVARFTVASVLGPREQTGDVLSAGKFSTSGPTLSLDRSCDSNVQPSTTTYSFTDSGTGVATLLIKTVSETYGDTYLELEATKAE